MKLQNVRFLNGGYCWQFNYFTGRPSNPRNSAAPCGRVSGSTGLVFEYLGVPERINGVKHRAIVRMQHVTGMTDCVSR